MENTTRMNLISALADEFNTTNTSVDTSNFIEDTGALDCTALGLDIDTLEKTINVINEHIAKFNNKKDVETTQYIAHLKVAKKCVEEVLLQKRTGRK